MKRSSNKKSFVKIEPEISQRMESDAAIIMNVGP